MKLPKMNQYFRIIIPAFLLVISSTVQAQLLSIQDAVDQAIQNNARINQMRAQLSQSKQAWRIQTGIASPEISYMKEGIHNKAADPFQEQRISLSQSLDFPLTSVFRLKALKEEQQALEFSIREEERVVKTRVKARYVDVLYALYLQKLREQQLKLSTELYNAVYTQFETGMGNGMDLIKAELQVAEANNDIDDARRQLHQARYALFNLMGLSPENQKYTIQFMDTLRTHDVEISQITALSVLTEQPAFQATVKQLDATNYYLKEAKSNVLPDIRFNLYKQDYGTGYHFNGFEVGLNFPLWYALEQKGMVRINRIRQEEIQWKQKEIRSAVKEQIEHAWHSYEVSRSVIKRYDETIRSKAEKLQALTLSAYRLGEVDLLNLINAQQIYLNSQQRYLSALHDFYVQLVELERFLNLELVY